MSVFATKLASLIACTCAIVAGTWCLTDYANRPGRQGEIAETFSLEWAASEWSLDQDFDDKKCTLVLFYHPHCPCTKATARCLQRLFTRFDDRPNFVAVAYCPDIEDDVWIESTLTSSLRELGPSHIVIDRDGRCCRRFGVFTSGHAIIYDVGGSLVFSGGITPGRGHEGHSSAASDLVAKVNGRSGEVNHWPVYGCTIVDSEAKP